MKTLNPDKATDISASMIKFAGEELSDWAARQPKIGPANDARIKAALITGFWLQECSGELVQAMLQHSALLAVAEAAEKAVQAMGNNAPGMYELDKALSTLTQLQGKANE